MFVDFRSHGEQTGYSAANRICHSSNDICNALISIVSFLFHLLAFAKDKFIPNVTGYRKKQDAFFPEDSC